MLGRVNGWGRGEAKYLRPRRVTPVHRDDHVDGNDDDCLCAEFLQKRFCRPTRTSLSGDSAERFSVDTYLSPVRSAATPRRVASRRGRALRIILG